MNRRTLAVLIAYSAPFSAGAGIINFDVRQVDFDWGAFSVPNSDWGTARFTYSGTSGIQYYNLTVNGRWAAINVPVLSNEGLGIVHERSVSFSLGNKIGSEVTSGMFAATLSDAPLGSAPTGAATMPVTQFSCTIGSIEDGLEPPGPAPTLDFTGFADVAGGALPPQSGSVKGMPNRNVGVDECVPGAFVNSLEYLNTKFNLNIPENKRDMAAMKAATHWRAPNNDAMGNPIPGTGGTGRGWVSGKREAVKNWVTTREFTANQLDDIVRELKAGQDVELITKPHGATLVGLTQGSDGSWAFEVSHDTDQKSPNGGTTTETFEFDPAVDPFLHGGFGFNNQPIAGFIVECPIPEPCAMLTVSCVSTLVLAQRRSRRHPE